MEYLALIWGTIVMVGTGFVLWFKTWLTKYLPAWGYNASEMVHFYEAVLAFSTIIVWHLYAVFNHTEKPPFNSIWINGQMSVHDMEHYHSEYLGKIAASHVIESSGEKSADEELWEP
jgi:hypothetical protein